MGLGNVLIIGDSYSTFKGYIPEGYATYYSPEGHPESGVSDVKKTWWKRLVDKTESELVLNCSWSGTTICHTGYNKADYSGNSFAARLDKLIENGFFEKNAIDTVLIFGGTNDSWAGSPVGELMFADWQKENLYSVLPAFCYILKRLSGAAPQARVINLVNTGLNNAVAEGMVKACEHYGMQCIKFDCIDKECGHPTAKGMEQICEQILNTL